jgi:hypothetical protein
MKLAPLQELVGTTDLVSSTSVDINEHITASVRDFLRLLTWRMWEAERRKMGDRMLEILSIGFNYWTNKRRDTLSDKQFVFLTNGKL